LEMDIESMNELGFSFVLKSESLWDHVRTWS